MAQPHLFLSSAQHLPNEVYCVTEIKQKDANTSQLLFVLMLLA